VAGALASSGPRVRPEVRSEIRRRIPSHVPAVLSHEYLAATSWEDLHHSSGFLRIPSAASARAFTSPSLTLMPFLPSSTVSETPGTS
jgi:hypothetical protein